MEAIGEVLLLNQGLLKNIPKSKTNIHHQWIADGT